MVSFLLRVREAVLHTNTYKHSYHVATSQLIVTTVLHPLLSSSSYSLLLSLCSTQSIKPRPAGVLHYILYRNQYCQKTAKSGAKSDFTANVSPACACCVCKEPQLIVLSKTKLQSIFSCQKINGSVLKFCKTVLWGSLGLNLTKREKIFWPNTNYRLSRCK